MYKISHVHPCHTDGLHKRWQGERRALAKLSPLRTKPPTKIQCKKQKSLKHSHMRTSGLDRFHSGYGSNADKPVRGIHQAQAQYIRGEVQDTLLIMRITHTSRVYFCCDSVKPGFDELPQCLRTQQQC